MSYQPLKSIKKGALPIAVVVLANLAIAIIKAQGLDIDESIVWTIATMGYGAIVAFINWLKNRKKAS